MTATRPIRFFLVNKVTEGQMKVAVFAHALGAWVRRDYTVTQGDPIGRVEPQQKVMNPVVGREQETSVDFTTGAVALDFSETAVVGPTAKTSNWAQMIYLADDGQLKPLVAVTADRNSDEYKEFEQLDAQTKAPVRPAGKMGPPLGAVKAGGAGIP